MAFQQLTGGGMWVYPTNATVGHVNNGGFVSSVIDATGEKYGWVGRVWFPGRTGTKDIRRVGFLFGSVTKAGGSALTLSLQDVSTSAGSPGQPDETQDQTVAVANADAAFVSNTWYRSGAFSADRTVTYGDPLAVVAEYDGAGRLGADVVNFRAVVADAMNGNAVPVLKTAGWARAGTHNGNLLLEFSDGTFGALECCLPAKTYNTHAFNSGSVADEFALPFSFPFACKIDGLRFLIANASSVDIDVVLYTGTTATQTVSIDGNSFSHTGAVHLDVPIPETELAANTTYYAAVKPTTTTSISLYSFDVDDANHLTCYPGGPNFSYTNRVDAGSWAAVTTTRRLLAGVRVSSVHDGTGGGGGAVLAPGNLVGGIHQ